jgi:hypothetical protein
MACKLIDAALFRLINLYKTDSSESEVPNSAYVDYNTVKSALVASLRDLRASQL